ncbi:MAG TPA: DNA repair protein RecO [Bacteroidia bacterium]|nr:DNA repair protein RecO [Bacteroidia bacterium]
MLHKTSGIILQTTNYSDTSLIAKIYTENFGLQSYMISGVRSKKSKTKASLFQPMTIVEIEVSNSSKSNLHRISEIAVQHPYSDIPYNIVKSSIAIFLNEVLFRSLKEQEADEDLYSFIKNSLLILDFKNESCSNFHLCFLIQISKFFGFYPQGNFSETTSHFDLCDGKFISSVPSHNNYLNPTLSFLLDKIMSTKFENIQGLMMDSGQRKTLLNAFVFFFKFHIPSFGEIKSMAVLEEVIS